jgi:Fe-S-cluster containining protein
MDTIYLVFTDVISRGIRVDCDYRKCGATCCRDRYARTVRLLPLDMRRLRYCLGNDYERHVDGNRLKIVEDHCTFLDLSTLLCEVYPFRPGACRTYPFHFELKPSNFFRHYWGGKGYARMLRRIREANTLFDKHAKPALPQGCRFLFVFLCPDCPEVQEEGPSAPPLPDDEFPQFWFKHALEIVCQTPVNVHFVHKKNQYVYGVTYEVSRIDRPEIGTVSGNASRSS